MEPLVIKVKRTGFPVEIGSNEFFFDSSIEGISKYQENYMKALEEINKLEIIDETDEEKHLQQRVEIFKKAYDIVFGEGSFSKIYEEFNDIIALENTFYETINGIEMYVKIVVDEYSKRTDDILSEYQNKFK